MITEEQLLKRDYVVKQIQWLVFEYRDYLKNPVETVCLDSIKYQLDFNFRELKEIDFKLKNDLQHYSSLLKSVDDLYQQVLIKQKDYQPFSVSDLPKYHYSLFQHSI